MPVQRGECFEDSEPFCNELKYLACAQIKIEFNFSHFEWLLSNFVFIDNFDPSRFSTIYNSERLLLCNFRNKN